MTSHMAKTETVPVCWPSTHGSTYPLAYVGCDNLQQCMSKFWPTPVEQAYYFKHDMVTFSYRNMQNMWNIIHHNNILQAVPFHDKVNSDFQ